MNTYLNELITQSALFSHSYFGALFLFIMLSIATGLGLPRQVAALSASMLFGVKLGFIIATAATVTGCMLTVITTRYLLADWVFKKFPDKTTTVHDFLSENTFLKALIIRILPLGSNFITNIVAGATRIPFLPYISGSFIGFIPQMVIFSLAGGGARLVSEYEQGIAILLTCLAVMLIIGLWIKKRLSKR